MRILHVVQTLDAAAGGLPAATVAIASAHARLGHEVTIVATVRDGDDPSAVDHPTSHGIDVHLFPTRGPASRFWHSPLLTAYVRDHAHEIDLVHVHSAWNLPAQQASRVAFGHGVPVVLSPHGSLDDFDVAKHRRAKQLLGVATLRRWLGRLSLVLCTSPREEQLLVTYGARPRTTSVPLPPGDVAPGRPGAARSRWGVPTGAPLVAFVGRLDYKKGLDRLVEAHALLDESTYLVLAGSGEPAYEDHVRAIVAASPAAARVVLTGWLDHAERADLLVDADVFALPSDRENYGIAVIEATQAGLPSVVSSEVFAGELVVEAGAALIADRTSAATAEAIRTALEPDRNRAMRAAAARLTAETLHLGGTDAAYQAALDLAISRR